VERYKGQRSSLSLPICCLTYRFTALPSQPYSTVAAAGKSHRKTGGGNSKRRQQMEQIGANRGKEKGHSFVYIDSTLVVPVSQRQSNSNAIRFDTLLGYKNRHPR